MEIRAFLYFCPMVSGEKKTSYSIIVAGSGGWVFFRQPPLFYSAVDSVGLAFSGKPPLLHSAVDSVGLAFFRKPPLFHSAVGRGGLVFSGKPTLLRVPNTSVGLSYFINHHYSMPQNANANSPYSPIQLPLRVLPKKRGIYVQMKTRQDREGGGYGPGFFKMATIADQGP